MIKLIASNLRERPTRTVVSVLAIGLGVALVLASVGLANGQLTDHAVRLRNVGGDFIFQAPNSSHVIAASSAALHVKIGEKISQIEGVDQVAPILVKLDGFQQLFGVEGEGFQRFNPNLEFVEGRMFHAPDEAIVDDLYANDKDIRVGDTITMLRKDFRVSGIFRQGTAVRRLIPLQRLQELMETPDKCSVFFIRVRNQSEIPEVEKRLKEAFDGYTITRSSDLLSIWRENTPVVKHFVAAIVSIAAAISFLIILLSMYSTITERTREIGILKSLGASKSYIVQLILKESLLISFVGVGVGFLLNALGLMLVKAAFPTLPVDTPVFWRYAASAIAIFGGTVGALYPAIKAAQLDPVRALGYE